MRQCHRLLDIWSPRSTCKEPILLNFTDASALVEYLPERGLDFAVIVLPDTILQMFPQTIYPFTHEQWIHQANLKFDFFAILGIPSVDATQYTGRNGIRHTITTFPNPRVILVEACLDPPSDTQETIFPQFVGRIHPSETISDIVGTSGGPIFGFRKNEKIRYTIGRLQFIVDGELSHVR